MEDNAERSCSGCTLVILAILHLWNDRAAISEQANIQTAVESKFTKTDLLLNTHSVCDALCCAYLKNVISTTRSLTSISTVYYFTIKSQIKWITKFIDSQMITGRSLWPRGGLVNIWMLGERVNLKTMFLPPTICWRPFSKCWHRLWRMLNHLERWSRAYFKTWESWVTFKLGPATFPSPKN